MKKILMYAAALVFTPLVVGAAMIAYRFATMDVSPAVPYRAGDAGALDARDPSRLDAVIVAGNAGTEGSDFLVPYQLLSMSGAFNVHVAMPERVVSPLTPASIDVMPEYSFTELDEMLGGDAPDLIVVPYLPDAAGADWAVVEWIRGRVGDTTIVLGICGGAEMIAMTGLLEGRRATTHHSLLARLAQDFPDVSWVGGQRWVEDGHFVTSGAILSGFDATLHVVRRMVGEDVARRVAHELAYPHVDFLDDPAYQPPRVSFVTTALNLGYRWRPARVGLEVRDGVDEIELAAAIDTYPHSYALELVSFGSEQRVHRSRHGLAIVPRHGPIDTSKTAYVLTPGSRAGADGAFPFEGTLADVSRRYGRNVAAVIAWGLGYPASEEVLSAGAPWPADPTARPVLLGLLAVAVLALARRRGGRGGEPADAAPCSGSDVSDHAAPRESPSADTGAVREYTLEARPATWEIAPGRTVEAWTYNGQVPGPTLVAQAGDTLVVRLVNHLAEPTTIHWHGIRLPAAMDGTELTQRPIAPGETFEYRFVVPDAGTFWYHPHADETVQMERGLYGALIVRGADEPVVDRERMLVLDDMHLDRRGRFKPFGGLMQRHNGRSGRVRLTNGLREPTLEAAAGQVERWRVVNAASARYVRLSIGGRPFRLVGTDGGLVERPVPVTEILVTPGERVDLLVGPFQEGDEVPIQALPYNRGVKQRETESFGVLRVGDRRPSAAVEPGEMRRIAPLAPPDAPASRTVRLGGRMSLSRGVDFMIDDEVHKHEHRPVRVGELQIWEVVNETPLEHPFHLHGFFFQVLEIDGVAPSYRAWKDTVNVPAKGRMKIAWIADDRPGPWMYHCHILEHAEAGMMAHFEVVR